MWRATNRESQSMQRNVCTPRQRQDRSSQKLSLRDGRVKKDPHAGHCRFEGSIRIGFIARRFYFFSAVFFSFSGLKELPIAGEPESIGWPFGYPDSETPVIELLFDSGLPHPQPPQNVRPAMEMITATRRK
jgi:hypothetical protein